MANDTIIRFQHNPLLTDTVGFFDYCIPLTTETGIKPDGPAAQFYNLKIYDYISPPPAPRKLIKTVSVFEPHNLKPKHDTALMISKSSNDWITLAFLACFIIFAWIQTYYSKRLSQVYRAVFQPHFINQLEREGNIFKERLTLGLAFIYYTSISSFIYQLISFFASIPLKFNPIAATGIIAGLLLSYQLLKSLIVHFTGKVFETRESARSYQLNILIFNHIIGLVLLPVTLISYYWQNSVLLTIGIIITSLLYIYRFFRGVLTGLANKNFNLFYLILYLCTLEILPLMLLYAAISKM